MSWIQINRLMALVMAAFKIMYVVMLNKTESHIESDQNKFGFKCRYTTDLCIYSPKNIIQPYKNHNSPMFTCFPGAFRAFDRVVFRSLSKNSLIMGPSVNSYISVLLA